jgi:hypothetical protein
MMRAFVVAGLAVVVTACTDKVLPLQPEPDPPSVRIEPYQSHVQIGVEQQLQVTVKGIEDTGVYYGYRSYEVAGGSAVNDPYIVRLNRATGSFRANSVGTAILVVRSKVYGDKIDTAVVTVDPPPAERRIAFRTIATADGRTCGISVAAETFCWGANRSGGLGTAATSLCGTGRQEIDYPCNPLPGKVAGAPAFASIAVSQDHACGLTSAGMVFCWGRNLFGEVGNSTVLPVSTPLVVTVPGRAVSIGAGPGRSCAVTEAATLYCWGIIRGSVFLGEFGGPGCFFTERCTSIPVLVEGIADVTRVSVGHGHTCALRNDGAAFCWGPNTFGQLGTGNYVDSNVPQRVQTSVPFVDVSVGSTSTCALTATGEAYCWGLNGVPTNSCDLMPLTCTPTARLADPPRRYRQLVAKDRGACGITTAGEVYCWGARGVAGLPDGSNLPGPTRFAEHMAFASLASGFRGCGIVSSGHAYCWASPNGSGEMGNGKLAVLFSSPPPDGTPNQVEGPPAS